MLAFADYSGRYIGFNLGGALLIDNPLVIYKAMFHEFQHIWHNNASLYKTEIPLPKLFIENRKLPYPIVKWQMQCFRLLVQLRYQF